MGTLGLLTIVRQGKVWAKVCCTCNGHRAEELAGNIIDGYIEITPAAIYREAERVGFGCDRCLTVVTEAGYVSNEEPPPHFSATLQDALRHPADTNPEPTRWGHTYLVTLEV